MSTTRIGKFIKESRKQRGITQKQLAKIAEVSFTFVNRLENGDPRLNFSKVNKVLSIFGRELGPIKKHETEE